MEYKNVYISVCDILGFKEILINNDLETTKKIFNKFVSNLELAVTGGKAIQYECKDGSKIVANPEEIRLNFNLFSDTVILWTNDDSVKSFYDLLIGTANLFNSSMKVGLPLRGAISQGDLLVNPFQVESKNLNFENVILGNGLIKSYQLEQNQNWSGCIIDPDFIYSSQSAISMIFKDELQRDLYIIYEVPLKSKRFRKMLTLNWVNWADEDNLSEEMIRNSFEAHKKSVSDSCVLTKIENTLNYYKYSRDFRKHFIKNNRN